MLFQVIRYRYPYQLASPQCGLYFATYPLIGRSWYFNQAYTWLQSWELIPSVAGFVGLT